MPGLAEDFDAIEEAVKESRRGRWFLEEYARRVRRADTTVLLDAMGRLESAVTASNDRLAERLSAVLNVPARKTPDPHWRDDDVFESPPPPAPVALFPLTSRREEANDRAKDRIVIIRRKPGERVQIPLQEEAATSY